MDEHENQQQAQSRGDANLGPHSPAEPEDQAKEPSSGPTASGRPRVTAAAVGAGATLLAALAALLTAAQGWFPDGGPSSPAPIAVTDGIERTPPALDRLIYSDSLLKPGVFAEDRYRGCSQTFTDVGYRIRVQAEFGFCDDTAASAALSGLRSVRIEATAVWTLVPRDSYRQFGAGDASLRCRGEREAADATGYLVGLTSSGAWNISRYKNGKQMTLAEGRDPTLDPGQGDAQRLRLDCLQLERGDVRLVLYVDDVRVAGFTDASPAPPGVTGLAAGSFTKEPFAVTFRDFRVYGPS